MKQCSIDGCEKPAKGHGWCMKHHRRWYRHGDPLTVMSFHRVDVPCSVENCEGLGRRRGWCNKHYLRWLVHGDPLIVLMQKSVGKYNGQLCSVEDCETTAFARSWCEKHYRRWRKHGDPLAVVGQGRRSTHELKQAKESVAQ